MHLIDQRIIFRAHMAAKSCIFMVARGKIMKLPFWVDFDVENATKNMPKSISARLLNANSFEFIHIDQIHRSNQCATSHIEIEYIGGLYTQVD